MAIAAVVHQQTAETVDYTPTVDTPAGEVVFLGGTLAGVTTRPIKAGELGALRTLGVIRIEKDATEIAEDNAVHWDATAKKATSTATGNKRIGVPVTAAAEAATHVDVIINAG